MTTHTTVYKEKLAFGAGLGLVVAAQPDIYFNLGFVSKKNNGYWVGMSPVTRGVMVGALITY